MFLSKLMPVEKALHIVQGSVSSTGTEKSILEDAYQRVLGEEVVSKFDSPPFERASMDGYALKAEDTFGHSQTNPRSLKIIDRIGAGEISSKEIRKGESVQIATGAPVPKGADAVVMEEYTRSEDDNLQVEMPLVPGENVSPAGEDLKRNDTALKCGKLLKPQDLGIIASAGYRKVDVFKKPSVGVMTTGSELVMPKNELEGAEIINSNHFTIKSLVESSLAIPEMTHCIDNRKLVKKEFTRLLEKNDALITTGGTAISKGDVVVDVASDLGEVLIHGVGLRPGKPFAFAVIDDKPVFMLSGYPVAAMVQFDVFVRENLLRMQGINRTLNLFHKIASRKIPSSLGRTDYIRAKIEGEYVTPLKTKGSGIIRSMVESNAYIIIEENLEGIAEGENCMVLPYDSLKA